MPIKSSDLVEDLADLRGPRRDAGVRSRLPPAALTGLLGSVVAAAVISVDAVALFQRAGISV